jgi:hypothetical protein
MMGHDDQPMDERDEGELLLVELRRLINRADAVPDRVDDAARAAYTWRTIDAELAELTRDSLVDADDVHAVRSGDGPRLLSFESPRLALELEVADLGRQGRRLVGQLVPPGPAAIVVEHAGGRVETEADELGRFVVEGLRPGPTRVRCRVDDGAGIETEWTQL